MFTSVEWKQLGGLFFAARELARGAYAGQHASALRGQGVEFHDYRPYSPGDQLARVDWKLFGRTDRFYLRLNRVQSDTSAYLLVDASASMDFPLAADRGAGVVSKLEYAAQLAAGLAFVTVQQGDRAGLGIADQQLRDHQPIAGTWGHLQQVCRCLDQVKAAAGPGQLARSIEQVHAFFRGAGGKGLARSAAGGLGQLVVISDLLDEPGPLLDALRRHRHGRVEVIVLQTLSPAELNLEMPGPRRRRWIDPETQRGIVSDLQLVRTRYQQALRDHISVIREGCARMGAQHELISTDQPVVAVLQRFLTQRARGWGRR